jgi:small subunit ribosomal protein S18
MGRYTSAARNDGKRMKSRNDEPMVKRRSRHLEGVTVVPIQDHEFLQRMMTDHGKILPSRLTGATAKQQRRIKRGVRRLRVLGLLP